MIKFNIPKEIKEVVQKIKENGFEAYLVGGCVRDLFLNKKINDWDITTDANPEEIQNIFEHTFYENNFGTVGVVNDKIKEELLILNNKIIELKKKELEVETYLKDDIYIKISDIKEKIKEKERLEIVEVTPYRIESKYSDNRRPDEVIFSKK